MVLGKKYFFLVPWLMPVLLPRRNARLHGRLWVPDSSRSSMLYFLFFYSLPCQMPMKGTSLSPWITETNRISLAKGLAEISTISSIRLWGGTQFPCSTSKPHREDKNGKTMYILGEKKFRLSHIVLIVSGKIFLFHGFPIGRHLWCCFSYQKNSNNKNWSLHKVKYAEVQGKNWELYSGQVLLGHFYQAQRVGRACKDLRSHSFFCHYVNSVSSQPWEALLT